MLRQLAIVLLAGFVAASPALAKNEKNKGNNNVENAGEVLLEAVITAAEIAIIYDYIAKYGTAAFGPPQGLPPGIAKNLARGKPLPPGIAKRYLPQDLLAQLPPRPGYEWLAVGRDILLVVAATAIIVDVLNDVL